MSSDEDYAKNALATLGTGPAAKELYVDLLKPAAQETSKHLLAVTRLIGLALAPLHGMVWGGEKIRDWLSAALLKRLASADPQDVQPPVAYVAGQILLQLPFCADQEQLREMYASLLASAMNKQRAGEVHPAFVQIIQQLTPDEALVLKRIASLNEQFDLSEDLDEDGARVANTEYVSAQFERFCLDAGVASPALSDAYLDNLLRLKVLKEDRFSKGKFHPAGVTRHGDYEAHMETVSRRFVQLSAFGERFLRTCAVADLPFSNVGT